MTVVSRFVLNETLLYRGDAQQIDRFDVGKTAANGLFGPGIYLTSDSKVAHDYTAARHDERVYPVERVEEVAKTTKELVAGYVKFLASEFDENKFKDEWCQKHGYGPRYSGLPSKAHAELDRAMEEAKRLSMNARMPKAIQQAKLELPNLRAMKLTTGEMVLVRKDRTSAISVFDIPDAYLARTLHSDRPLPDKVLAVIRKLWMKTFPKDNGDMRDANEKKVGFDAYVTNFKNVGTRYAWRDDEDSKIGGKGQNPSLDDIRNGTHGGYHAFVDNFMDDDRKNSGALITALSKLGYVGLEYDGGKRVAGYVRGGGGKKHRAFVFWDADALSRFRIDNQALPRLKGVSSRSLPVSMS